VTLHPWQVHAAAVAGELVPDPDTGRPVHAYDTVVLSLPRRAGKSLLVLLWLLRVMFAGRGMRSWYTAQSRADAVVTLRDEWVPTVEISGLAPFIGSRLSNGSEALYVPRLASASRVFAPTPASLHGQAGDLIVFDEAWSFTAARGAELEIASRPLMATRPGAQTVIASAAGDVDSTWWLNWLERGRAAVAADTGRGICLLEWSADVAGLDHADPAVWIASHPAIRHAGYPDGTIPLAFLEAEYERDPAKFVRLYLNVTDRAGTAGTPFDVDRWDALATTWNRRGAVAFGIDSSPDQASTAVLVAGIRRGVPVLEVADYRPGQWWAVERVAELCDRYNPVAVGLDPVAPVGAIAAPLRAAGVPVVDLQLRDMTAAAAQLVEAIRTSSVRHVPHPVLDAAIAGARRRHVGDGSWLIGRVDSGVDVCALVAGSIARYLHPDVNQSAPGVF